MLASAAAMSGSALAAGTVNQYGSVKLQWNVAVQMTAAVHTNYTAAFANGGGTATVGANPAGDCGTTPTTQTDLNMTWGTLQAPAGTAYVGCNYENAIGVSVLTNDANGYQVWEYMDEALPAGTAVCALANDAAKTFPVAGAASITTSQYTTAPAPYTGAACGAGTALVAGAGSVTNANAAPTQPAAPAAYTGEYLGEAAGSTGLEFMSGTAGTTQYAGEDIQMNVNSTAPSTTTNNTEYITLQFVAE
jgi:hypothetical protein